MTSIRRVIALPALLLAILLGGIGIFFGWLCGPVHRLISITYFRHIYFPIVQIERWICGERRWQPRDLQLGVQPEHEIDRKIAAEHMHVEPACECGNPSCPNNGKFRWSKFAKQRRRMDEIMREEIANAKPPVPTFALDELPPTIRDEVLKGIRQMAGADKLEAKIEDLNAQLANREMVIGNQTALISNGDALIKNLQHQLERYETDVLALHRQLEELKQRNEAFRQSHTN